MSYEEKRNHELPDSLARLQTSGDSQRQEDAKRLRILELKIDAVIELAGGSPEKEESKSVAKWDQIYVAYQRAPFIEAQRHREQEEKCLTWIVEARDKPLLDKLILPAVGPPCSWPNFRCGPDKTPYDGAKLLQDLFLRRGFALDTKEKLLATISKELLEPNATYAVNCPKCFGQSVYFRIASRVAQE